MTTIAWDGRTLAADRRAVSGQTYSSKVVKIHRVRDLRLGSDFLVGFSGEADQGLEMLEWLRQGAKPESFPPAQRTDKWCNVLVIDAHRRILTYEQTPYPIERVEAYFAIGSGREYAVAAMYLGMDARAAVLVASRFDPGTGNGIDALDWQEGGE